MLLTAFLIIALVIAVSPDGARAQFYTYEEKNDQLAQEAKNRAVTILDGPTYVAPPSTPATPANRTQPDKRPPTKPPLNPTPDKGKPKYVELPRVYYAPIQNVPRNPYPKLKVQHPTNSVYKYHKVIPLPHRNTLYPKQQIIFAASTSKPSFAAKSPKFSLPVETINGIRADFVRPPHVANSTTTSTTTTATTTVKYLRTKRIWPKHILEKTKATTDTNGNYTTTTRTADNKTNTDNELNPSASHHRIYVIKEKVEVTSAGPSTRPPYRRVTRVPKKKPSTPAPANYTHFQPNDWVPITPSHYPVQKKVRKPQTPISKRSDRSEVYFVDPNESPAHKRMMYLHSFGLFPATSTQNPTAAAAAARKNLIFVGKSKPLKPHVYSGYRGKPGVHKKQYNGDYYQTEESIPSKYVTRIKHHHHHHHHRYVKTVEKPVKVEVPKPVPYPVPVPVKVEKQVPYPVHVNVPHPVPVKVIEKEYVPKPYPVYQQVPIVKHVAVKVPQPVTVHVEKRVPYPVQVEVPVPKPYPVHVTVEKKVPYPVPVRVLVPQPYPVETKVPVPVKEPVEVIKHVAVRVPVPQPYPVRVPQPVPVPFEKKVPYPVEVEKKVTVPVPYRIFVPEKVEVEKKVPVYVPRPYPVEKKVPYPVRVPYPVQVPIKVPVGIPIIMHPSPNSNEHIEHIVSSGLTVGPNSNESDQQYTHYAYSVQGNAVSSTPQNTVETGQNTLGVTQSSTDSSHETVTFHGNTISSSPYQTIMFHGIPGFHNGFNIGFQNGFRSRIDDQEYQDETTTPFSSTQGASTEVVLNTPEESVTALSTTEVDEFTTPTLDPR